MTAGGDERAWQDVLVAIDVGTSGARAAAFDLEGRRHLEVRRSYPTRSPRPGWAEQDSAAWRSAALASLTDLVERIGPKRRVHAIGLTGQCPSAVLLDGRDRPVRPGLIYRDNRAVAEADRMRREFGDRWLHTRTGHRAAAFHILPKLLWVREHEPESWARVRHVLQPRDWVGFVLTGVRATDGSHAAATLAFDLGARRWDGSILDRLEVPSSLFPEVRRSDDVLATLLPAVASRVGLPATTPVVVGGADSQACALGCGATAPGPVSEMAGSSTCLNETVPRPLDVLDVTHYPHVVGDGYTTETGINTTGAALKWVADLLYGGRSGRAGPRDFERLDREAGASQPGADGALLLPALADGERTDPGLRAALTGLSIRHDRATLARAALEGVAFEIREQLGLLAAGGAPANELRISGGDVRLRAWNQIKADVIGLPVRIVDGDAAVTGVAMLAGIGAGVYRDATDAIRCCVRLGEPIEPNPATRAVYDDAAAAFAALERSAVVRRPA